MANKEIKPTFKMSVSLINKYLYYKNNPYDNIFEQLKEALDGVWKDSPATIRGNDYEDSVFAGNEGKISEVVKDAEHQKWARRTLDMGNFKIVFNGKYDAADSKTQRLYDIKRVNNFKEKYYSDESTCQHTVYFWLDKEKKYKDFYYLIAAGGDVVEDVHVVHHARPTEEELEERVKQLVTEFLRFLANKKLIQKYQENYEVTQF